jgi:AcrR family transcriptional regulator
MQVGTCTCGCFRRHQKEWIVAERSESDTASRIMHAFIHLAAERGIDATTTRAVAEAAGVNEVTIFRHFGDKATLAHEAIRHNAVADRVGAFPLAIDTSTPERAAAGLRDCLRFLRATLRAHPEFLQFGISESWRYPELADELAVAPMTARALVERALLQAAPVLQPNVDPQATTLSLLGLVLITVLWQARGWVDLTDAAWDQLIEAAIRPLMRQE